MGLLGGVFQLTEFFPNGIPLPFPLLQRRKHHR